MKTLLIGAALALAAPAAFAMVGFPLLPVGMQTSAMSVEATHTTIEMSGAGIGGSHELAVSDRVSLTARFGVLPHVDLSATAGTADLRFSELSGGYSAYAADWSVAWGAGARAEFPLPVAAWHVLAGLNYTGFRPTGETSNGLKSIESRYLRHEVTPTVAAGYTLGAMMPYVALSKPYLFGRRETTMALQGMAAMPLVTTRYSDPRQPLRGALGMEWKLPEGYAVGAEAATTTDGHWTLSVALAQVLK